MQTRAPIDFAWLVDTFYCLCIVCLSIREVTFSVPIIKYIKQYSRGALICVYLNHIGVFARSVIKKSTKNRHIWLTHIKKKYWENIFQIWISIFIYLYTKNITCFKCRMSQCIWYVYFYDLSNAHTIYYTYS